MFHKSKHNLRVKHVFRSNSGHAISAIELEARSFQRKKRKTHVFRFKEVWSMDDRCEEEIRRAWYCNQDYYVSKIVGLKSLGPLFEKYTSNNIIKNI